MPRTANTSSFRCRNFAVFGVVLLIACASLPQRTTAATTINNTRSEVAQMATFWETDSIAISPLATSQYPQFTGDWQYIFPNSGISADGDVHVNMAVDAIGTGANGNNLGTASPIVAELINASSGQFSYLTSLRGTRAAPRGVFRLYTEHSSERHFELHPITQLLRWNGSSFVLDTDYHANLLSVPDGATHASSTYTNLLNGSQTITAAVAADNLNVTFTYPSPSVNYVQYDGVVVSEVATDSVSSYFTFQPTLVPSATVRCRIVSSTEAAGVVASIVPGQAITVNALTRTDMAAVSDQISSLLASETLSFPRPIEFITLGAGNLGPAAITGAATGVTTTQATLSGTVNPNGSSTLAYFQYGTSTSYGVSTASQNIGSGTSIANISQQLSGLNGNATYHFRIVATNGYGTTFGADHTFSTTQVAVPTITTEPATSVVKTTATLNALVNPNNFATSMHFEFGRTTAYGTSTATQNIGSGAVDVAVTAALSGLRQSQLYHFRAVATNSNGTTTGPDQVFTTAPRLPTAVTAPATNITTDSATLNGTVNPGSLATNYYFEYGTSSSYGTVTSTRSAGSGLSDVAVSADLTAILQKSTTYHFRLVATNSRGTSYGSDLSFTTIALPPVSTTLAANPVGYSGATLNGTVNPNGVTGSAQFEYGTTIAYGNTTASQSVAASGGAVSVSQAISGLTANTTYHFRIIGTNSGGTTSGADATFNTASSAPPLASVQTASAVGLTTAVLNASVNGNSANTTVYFEYGTTAGYGTITTVVQIPIGTTALPISWAIEGLMAGTTYHYRVVANNSSGTGYSTDQTFTTLAAQQLFTYSFSDVTTSSGTSSAGGVANNVTFSNFTAVGTSANSNAAGRFSFTSQPLGATTASDIFTGALDPAKYFQMSVTPSAGFTLNVSSIAFTMQRSGTGIRQYSVRSAADSFASNLAAAISPGNSNLTIVSSPQLNIFQVSDASTSANTGSVVMPGLPSAALTQSLAFRLYGFNAEGTSGTFSVDDVAIFGAVTLGGVPLITNSRASVILTNKATLNADIDPNGAPTTFYFMYGTSAAYGKLMPAQTVASSTAAAQDITGLISYTTYHYRLVAANSTGVSYGPDQTFTTAPGDRDGDGMPDDYEVLNGFNPDDPSDALLDSDGDGFTNVQEFIAGTNPRNASDRLHISAVEMTLSGFEITFPSVIGRKYRIEQTGDLIPAAWSVLADNIPGSGTPITITDDTAISKSRNFYRVMIVP